MDWKSEALSGIQVLCGKEVLHDIDFKGAFVLVAFASDAMGSDPGIATTE